MGLGTEKNIEVSPHPKGARLEKEALLLFLARFASFSYPEGFFLKNI